MERTFYIPLGTMTEQRHKEFCALLPWARGEGRAIVLSPAGKERIDNLEDPLLPQSLLDSLGGYEIKTVSMFD